MNQVNELDFVHLHVHSEFSLVDGIIRVKELVNNSADRGFHSVALTDLTNLFGLLEFYRTARERGIKPIVGSEINIAKDNKRSDNNKVSNNNINKAITFIKDKILAESSLHFCQFC